MNWNVKLNDFFEGSSTNWDSWASYVKTNLEKKWPGNTVTVSRASNVHQFPIDDAGGVEKEVNEFIGSLWISWWNES